MTYFAFRFLHSPITKFGNKVDKELPDGIKKDVDAEGKICFIFKFIVYTVCLIFFFANSYAIFKNFASNTTIKSLRVVPPADGYLESPTLLICNSTPYKEPILFTDQENFKKNTMNKDDFFVDAFVVKNGSQGLLNWKLTSIKESVKEISTFFHGTCIIIDGKWQLQSQDIIWLEMNAKFDYTLYVIPPGEEIFVPNGLYPTLPATTILRKTLSYAIMHLKKQTSVKQGEYCNDTKGYKYGDCINGQMENFVNENEIGSTCSIAWNANFGGGLLDPTLKPCNLSEATRQSLLLADFFTKGCAYGFKECKEPCSKSTYQLVTSDYEEKSLITVKLNKAFRDMLGLSFPNGTKIYSAMLSFPTTNVDLTEEIVLNNISDFISAVGGNLGLFTGVSLLSILIQVVEWARKMQIHEWF